MHTVGSTEGVCITFIKPTHSLSQCEKMIHKNILKWLFKTIFVHWGMHNHCKFYTSPHVTFCLPLNPKISMFPPAFPCFQREFCTPVQLKTSLSLSAPHSPFTQSFMHLHRPHSSVPYCPSMTRELLSSFPSTSFSSPHHTLLQVIDHRPSYPLLLGFLVIPLPIVVPKALRQF